MRRLISVLAAGLLAAGTVLTAGGAASAAPAAAREANCDYPQGGPANYSVTAGSVTYWLATPKKLSSGSAAILRPSSGPLDPTTMWVYCLVPHTSDVYLLMNRGLVALTSRASSPGADVTLEPAGNGHNGFASQRWVRIDFSSTTVGWKNLKTGLFLRVRHGVPVMYQTVTTGSRPTRWLE